MFLCCFCYCRICCVWIQQFRAHLNIFSAQQRSQHKYVHENTRQAHLFTHVHTYTNINTNTHLIFLVHHDHCTFVGSVRSLYVVSLLHFAAISIAVYAFMFCFILFIFPFLLLAVGFFNIFFWLLQQYFLCT